MNDQEKKRAIVRASGPAINQYLFKRTVVIAPHHEVAPDAESGTGVLMQIEGIPIVLTAAHVIKDYPLNRLQITGADQPSNIRVAPIQMEADGGNDGETLDVGFLRLAEKSVPMLGKKEFITLDDFQVFPESLSTDLVGCLGYPQRERFEVHPGVYVHKSFTYYPDNLNDLDWATVQEDYWMEPYLRPQWVVLDYPPAVPDVFTGKWADLPEPIGLSGCGIWRMNYNDGKPIWSPASLRLIGVATEFDKPQGAAKGNRLEPMLRLLGRHFQSAQGYLDSAIKDLQARHPPLQSVEEQE